MLKISKKESETDIHGHEHKYMQPNWILPWKVEELRPQSLSIRDPWWDVKTSGDYVYQKQPNISLDLQNPTWRYPVTLYLGYSSR